MGGAWWQVFTKWWGFQLKDQMALIGIVLSSTYHKLYPNQLQISSASHIAIPSQSTTWPGKTQSFKYHPSTHGRLTGHHD